MTSQCLASTATRDLRLFIVYLTQHIKLRQPTHKLLGVVIAINLGDTSLT